MKKFLTVALCLLATFCAIAQEISLEDVVSGQFSQRSIRGIRPLADGESYSQISADGKQILRCSFKTGEAIETLFDISTARNHKLKGFSGYIMSPDEKNILIETNRQPIYRRSFTAEYYIYNVKNRTLTPLSEGGAQECPKFSPDGNVIAFVRQNNLFLVKLLYNNAESQVTKDGEMNKVLNGKPDWVYEEEFEFNCAYDFSSDSQMLAWIRFDETNVKTFSFPMYQGSNPAMTQYKLYPGNYEYKYPKAGEENSKVKVLTFDIKSRVTRTMQIPILGDGYIPRIQFTGDKDKLAVLALNRHQDRLDIYMVNPRSALATLVVREQADKYVDTKLYHNIDFSRDKFVILSERDGYQHLYLYTIGGQLVKQLTKGNYVVTNFYGTDATGQNFYYSSNEGSPLEQYIYKVDAKGKKTLLTKNKGFNSATFSKGCRYFLNTFSDISTPTVTSLYSSAGKQLKVLEDNAELKAKLASLPLGKQELFTFKTQEGVELNGWMVKPKDFNANKKYPVLMYQYSGPGSQEVHNSFSNGFFGGLVWEQRLAQKGYIVVCVDGRGTGGRGADFQKCTYMTMGDKESKDQVETAIYLASLPYIDKDRIAIWGWSFGGFNTIMSMCEGRPVFRCGVAVAPVTDWRFYDSAYTERYMRTPQENSDGYDISPLHRYHRLHGDILLCHGYADDNVHFQNMAELTEGMVQEGIQFESQFYTNRNHSIYGGNTRRHLFTRIENFLDKHLLK
ncbi:MAG: DPP IV N-terminal domain-containing protein [Bacteroides sp.]|nr:DPP IV N-terminal domain-containing protein [Roseburia sp.]MCM1345771.1 DPP IV N-terminal domain-containing protein [Bacteroides sp.]MCM1420134.1 DPP IV N-terminal domain-containing protein [Bacteroides sp.]